MSEAKDIIDTRTAKRKAMDEAKLKREADAKTQKALNAQYQQMAQLEPFQNLRNTISEFIEYHEKIAKDGCAYEMDAENKPKLMRLTPEQRVAHLDKAAAQQEILDFIDRRLA